MHTINASYNENNNNTNNIRSKSSSLVDDNKNVVAYGSVIRLPKDPNSNRFSEDLALVRATKAFQKMEMKTTRYNTIRFTNNVNFLDEETKTLIKGGI